MHLSFVICFYSINLLAFQNYPHFLMLFSSCFPGKNSVSFRQGKNIENENLDQNLLYCSLSFRVHIKRSFNSSSSLVFTVILSEAPYPYCPDPISLRYAWFNLVFGNKIQVVAICLFKLGNCYIYFQVHIFLWILNYFLVASQTSNICCSYTI